MAAELTFDHNYRFYFHKWRIRTMTREQFDRWFDFAVRMAEHGYPNATPYRREKILEEVKDYFR